ncbi:hypothetical protein [Oceanicella actignis]|uniref:Methyltransferase domain-containing protein n=1 Tax=Oceanicella actignis TaxID=1189325 RepID=A0A1M7SEE6_9RHOB|nr:hypothetical protein [Oceanicella actignis]SET23465.1 hypothetical protein SAMN04488119_103205 [Oceanicella actignis]SHN56861.1 hypothetical protein SAMN05216200_102303 [Oceanicella actignis]
MSGFALDWLDLRAPADRAARSMALARRLAAWTGGAPLAAVDLGAGAGATVQALAPLAPRLRWLLIDADAGLLAEARRRTGARTARADLSAPDEVERLLAGARVVAASAFFDLCSEAWIARFVRALPRDAAVLAALTYDGRERWSPADPAEPAALAAFHAHQRRDKGLGPALGPDAAPTLARMLRAAGWSVSAAPSPWRLGAGDAALIAALADGAAAAVGETGALTAPTLERWRLARRAARQVEIGHVDILALPPG